MEGITISDQPENWTEALLPPVHVTVPEDSVQFMV
jgi:hypothetical protein